MKLTVWLQNVDKTFTEKPGMLQSTGRQSVVQDLVTEHTRKHGKADFPGGPVVKNSTLPGGMGS